MEKRKSKNVNAARLAAEYGVSQERANQALEEDAPRPSVTAQKKPEDSAETRPEPAAEEPASPGPKNLLNARELAAAYSMDRDQFEQLLVAVGTQGVDRGDEKRYDAADVAARLAQRDAKAAGAVVVGFDAIQSDELAQALLGEVLNSLFEKWGRDCSEAVRAAIAAAKRNAAGRMSTFAARKARCAVDAAPTPEKRTAAEWALLVELERFRAAMIQALREHRRQNRNDR